MIQEDIINLKTRQEIFFRGGKTLDCGYRVDALKKLYKAILTYQEELRETLFLDLGKSETEADITEIRLALTEISFILKHIKKLSSPKKIKTELINYPGRSFSVPSPYGNVLIISPWNYPVLLTLQPLIDALAAGNTAIIKTSEYAVHTSDVIYKLIKSVFHEEYVAVINGGIEESKSLLDLNFDYIFFTGSKNVGKSVMKAASKHLTPVTLELGGKSPVVVAEDADIESAAKRIVFGKLMNAGQTCVAPDYILVDNKVHDKLVEALKTEMVLQYGENPLENLNYPKIINEKHFDRIVKLIDTNKVVHGGTYDKERLKISPTILDNVNMKDKVMKEEIFGPVLPIITFNYIDQAIRTIWSMEHPLALYIFSESKDIQHRFVNEIGFGGGCINDTLVHLSNHNLGFGGFRESGMGQYHGKEGFKTFSHYKSIYQNTAKKDSSFRYQPYS
ncbi:MAG: aldehyde dehydrogenase, partial [Sphaerochaetaceae bacterium]|nr:aldehyde dehydrogenase [Sphaerochaetaceae bacterium]